MHESADARRFWTVVSAVQLVAIAALALLCR